MSLIKLSKDRFEQFTLITNPRQEFVSSSAGTTGSVYLQARRSACVKDVFDLGTSTTSSDSNIETTRLDISRVIAPTIGISSIDASAELEDYLTQSFEKASSALNDKMLGVSRFTPTSGGFEQNVLKKSAVIDHLMPHYHTKYPDSHYAYTNYHCLNFFTASSVPSNTAIVYPNSDGGTDRPYTPSGSFTVDFYINPKYTTLNEADEFHAGTILHLSSTIALSLV